MESYRKILAERASSLRKEQKIKVPTILEYVDISRSTWDGYASGRRSPQGERLVRLAEVLNTTTDYLTGKTDEKYLSSDNIDKDNEDIYNLIKTLKGKPLTDNQKEALIETLNSIINDQV